MSTLIGKPGVSRRHALKATLGAVAAPAVLRVTPVNAQSRVIKIGHVSPRTGPLAGFGEADTFILEQVRGLLRNGITVGGRTYPVQIISKDSQSSGSRAAEVASELILGDKVDLIVASVTLSIGMVQLPPVMLSAPFKILLFVLVDGWNLVISSLVKSYA